MFDISYKQEMIQDSLELDFTSLLFFAENEDTPLEMDLRVRRLNRYLLKYFIKKKTYLVLNNMKFVQEDISTAMYSETHGRRDIRF